MIALGDGRGGWLKRRNALLRNVDGEKKGMMVCEGGVCNESKEYL